MDAFPLLSVCITAFPFIEMVTEGIGAPETLSETVIGIFACPKHRPARHTNKHRVRILSTIKFNFILGNIS
jgi:hypothetical protein